MTKAVWATYIDRLSNNSNYNIHFAHLDLEQGANSAELPTNTIRIYEAVMEVVKPAYRDLAHHTHHQVSKCGIWN